MLDVHRLVLLREVHLRGGITAAARARSYTHSAVSQQLALLEKEAGVPLLEKVGRGVRLTRAAEELVAHAESILAIIERAEADLALSHTEVRGTLRLAAFTTISRSTIPGVIRALELLHPALDVRFRQVEPEEGLVLLSSRQIDALVADSYPGIPTAVPDFHVDLLAHDPVRAYLPSGSELASLDGLRRIRWVLEPAGTDAHTWVRTTCLMHGFEPNVAYESSDLLFHLRMVETGLAAAFLPDLLLAEAGAKLTPSAAFAVNEHRRITLVCRTGAELHPAVAACRSVLESALKR